MRRGSELRSSSVDSGPGGACVRRCWLVASAGLTGMATTATLATNGRDAAVNPLSAVTSVPLWSCPHEFGACPTWKAVVAPVWWQAGVLATLSWCASHVAEHWSNISGRAATAMASRAASTTLDFRNIVSIVSEFAFSRCSASAVPQFTDEVRGTSTRVHGSRDIVTWMDRR